jgi:hypothetical protein
VTQYFIKRSDKVDGPFTDNQIKSVVKSGKLKDTDLISNSKDGSWKPMGIVFQKQTVQPQPTPKPSVSPDTQSVTSAESGPLLTPIPDSADLFAEDFEASASLPSLPSTRFSTTSSGASSTSAMGAEIPLPSRLSGAAQALTDAENELGKRREDNERMLKDWKSMLWIGGSTLVIVISLGAFLGYLAISKLSSGWDIFYATHEDKVMEDSAKIDRALEKSGSRNIGEHLRKQNYGTEVRSDTVKSSSTSSSGSGLTTPQSLYQSE